MKTLTYGRMVLFLLSFYEILPVFWKQLKYFFYYTLAVSMW